MQRKRATVAKLYRIPNGLGVVFWTISSQNYCQQYTYRKTNFGRRRMQLKTGVFCTVVLDHPAKYVLTTLREFSGCELRTNPQDSWDRGFCNIIVVHHVQHTILS